MPCLQRLVIFTRYPEAGKTKTRLIPGLGAEGAADLQRQMTEHMVAIAQNWLVSSSKASENKASETRILTSGGDESRFQAWLGDPWHFQPQVAGDLGDRMAAAFQAGFSDGCDRVVIIGIDCPDITAALLQQAFDRLEQSDLVLGPASDGGYYLIGLRASAQMAIPTLLAPMDWGTSVVRRLTLERAAQQQLQVALLTELTDVDHPEDLWVWQKHQCSQSP